MSYSYFVACSHPLPEGRFGARPLRIYNSYADYMRSADYVPVEQRRTHNLGFHAETPLDEEAHRAALKGPFLIYEDSASAGRQDAVTPIQPQDDWVCRLLTLPHQYCLGWSGLDPLCHFLQPDAKCELLSAWVGGDDRLPLSAARYQIDLSDYVLNADQSEDLVRFEQEESLHRNAVADVVPLAVPLSDAGYVRLDPAILDAAVGFTWTGNAGDCLFYARAEL